MAEWRIGVDCRLAGLAHAGIGRYTAELVQHLLQLSQKNSIQCVLFFSSEEQAREVLGGESSAVTVVLAAQRQYSWAEQWDFLKLLNAAKLDLLHVPHFNVPFFYRGTTVITIHDLLWHEQRGSSVTTLPAWQYWFKYLGYRVITARAISLASRIFVPTQFVAQSVSRWYPDAAAKLLVTPEGVNASMSRVTRAREKKTLLYVGSLYPHKNVTVVLEALTRLPDWQLVIVGARSVFAEETQHEVARRQLTEQVQFVGKVDDQRLAELYATATALIQPSLSEGFGLTGLEAIGVGTPVLASDIPVFHEVYQDAAVYFNPRSAADLVKVLREFSADSPEFSPARQQAVLAQYDWGRMAAQTYQVYKELLNVS